MADVITIELSTGDKRISKVASDSAISATTSAVKAALSENNAANSAILADTSATHAATSETNANISATLAITSENNAANSAILADTSAAHAAAAAATAFSASAPAWSPTTTYSYPTVVAYTDGQTYRCIGTNIFGEIPNVSSSWVRTSVAIGDFFVLDEDGDLMPSLNPGYNDYYTLDSDGDIMPR